MGRIVREHYPVNKLPEDLRQGLQADGDVRVIVEELKSPEPNDGDNASAMMERPAHVPTLEELFAGRRSTFSSGQEVDAHVRALRDEWE